MSRYGDPGARYRVGVDARQWWRKPAAVALAVLMMTAMVVLVPVVAKVASGQEVETFTPAFHADDNGAIAIFGNANESCPPGTIAPGTTPPHGSTAPLCDDRPADGLRQHAGRRRVTRTTRTTPGTWWTSTSTPMGARTTTRPAQPFRCPRGQPCFSPACSGRAACSPMPARPRR